MNRLGTRNTAAIFFVALVRLAVPSLATHAQRIPFVAGDIARAAWPDSAGQSTWLTGPITFASRDSLLLDVNGANRPVRFNEATRLQIRRGQRGHSALVGALGFFAGAGLGVRAAHPPEGSDDDATFGPMVGYAALGAIAGALLGKFLQVPRWEEIRITGNALAVAELSDPEARPIPTLGKTTRWTRFEPTGEDFEAFFNAHAESMYDLEGIWRTTGTLLQAFYAHSGFLELLELASGTGGLPIRVALVRDARLEGPSLGAFLIKEPGDRLRLTSRGLLFFVLTPAAGEDDWAVQFTGGSPRRYEVNVEGEMLWMLFPDGYILRWEKEFP
jgi:hypothetical protein